MAKERMSVQTVAEILIDELSKIEAQTHKFEVAARRVEETVKKLAENPVKVDVSEFKETVEEHKKIVSNSVIIPKRLSQAFYYTIIISLVLVMVSIFLAGKYYSKFKEEERDKIYWYNKANKTL